MRPTAVQKQLRPRARLRATTAEDGLLRKVLPAAAVAGRGSPSAIRPTISAAAARRRAQRSTDFAGWLEQAMATRRDGEWRLGPQLYARKYALAMDYPLGPAELLAEAEQRPRRAVRGARDRRAPRSRSLSRHRPSSKGDEPPAGSARRRPGRARRARRSSARTIPASIRLIADSYALRRTPSCRS